MTRKKSVTAREVWSKSRREFMRVLAIGGGAATLVAASARFVEDLPTSGLQRPATQPTASTGYHVTPHIEEYYRKAAL